MNRRRKVRMALFATIPLINVIALLAAPRDGQTILWNHETIALLSLSTGCTCALGWALKNAGDQVTPNIKEPMLLALIIILVFGVDRMIAEGVLDRLGTLIPVAQYPAQQVAVAASPIPATAIPPTQIPVSAGLSGGCDGANASGLVVCVANGLGDLVAPVFGLLMGLVLVGFLAAKIKENV